MDCLAHIGMGGPGPAFFGWGLENGHDMPHEATLGTGAFLGAHYNREGAMT